MRGAHRGVESGLHRAAWGAGCGGIHADMGRAGLGLGSGARN